MVTQSQEKITIIMPLEIKEGISKLKKEMKVSMNALYITAISEYLEKKNKEKLREETRQMVEEYKTNPEMAEWLDFQEDVCEC